MKIVKDESSKNRLVAFLLAFFLGMLGVHRFYVGKTGSGVAMLLLSISIIGTVVSWVWVIVDVIDILCGTFTDKEGNVLSKW
jgi:TM2 domain-containing membrane protein YozV